MDDMRFMPGRQRGALIQREQPADMRMLKTPDFVLTEAAPQNLVETRERPGQIRAVPPALRQAAHVGPFDAELRKEIDVEFNEFRNFIEPERVMLVRFGVIMKAHADAMQRAGQS